MQGQDDDHFGHGDHQQHRMDNPNMMPVGGGNAGFYKDTMDQQQPQHLPPGPFPPQGNPGQFMLGGPPPIGMPPPLGLPPIPPPHLANNPAAFASLLASLNLPPNALPFPPQNLMEEQLNLLATLQASQNQMQAAVQKMAASSDETEQLQAQQLMNNMILSGVPITSTITPVSTLPVSVAEASITTPPVTTNTSSSSNPLLKEPPEHLPKMQKELFLRIQQQQLKSELKKVRFDFEIFLFQIQYVGNLFMFTKYVLLILIAGGNGS